MKEHVKHRSIFSVLEKIVLMKGREKNGSLLGYMFSLIFTPVMYLDDLRVYVEAPK